MPDSLIDESPGLLVDARLSVLVDASPFAEGS
jgi:hypothetical protein